MNEHVGSEDAERGERKEARDGSPAPEASADDLDDQRDSSELRDRYDELLQEIRVVLPGVAVLVGFMLTAPFSSRFAELDDVGISTYLLALACAVGATVTCLAPTAYHRSVGRRDRSARVVWAIRLVRASLAFLAVSLVSAVFCVTRFIGGTDVAAAMTGLLAGLIVLAWIALPALTTSRRD